jgi:hypothetical protein
MLVSASRRTVTVTWPGGLTLHVSAGSRPAWLYRGRRVGFGRWGAA